MDSVALTSATQHAWLSGKRGIFANSERNSVKHDDLGILCRDVVLPLGVHKSVVIFLKKIPSCPLDFCVVDTSRLGVCVGNGKGARIGAMDSV